MSRAKFMIVKNTVITYERVLQEQSMNATQIALELRWHLHEWDPGYKELRLAILDPSEDDDTEIRVHTWELSDCNAVGGRWKYVGYVFEVDEHELIQARPAKGVGSPQLGRSMSVAPQSQVNLTK